MLETPALEVLNLSVGYAGENGIIPAVDRVSLSIARGEFMGLAGESGCGKSTIAQALLRLLRAPGIITGGDIRIAGNDMLSSDENKIRDLRWRTASIVLQNSLTSLNPVKRIRWQLEEVLARAPRGSAKKTPAELLRMVDIDPSRLAAFPHELSGGQRQRVVIAMALALEPQLIILDEPTTALDVIVQQEIFLTVKELQRRMGFAVLLITHDLPLLFEVADRIAVMKDGQIVENAAVAEFRGEQKHPYSRALLAATPRIDFSAAATKAAPAAAVLETRNLRKAYGANPLTGHAALIAVNDVTFRLAPKEIVALVGASGSGKSTFGRIVTGLTSPSGGDILVDGRRPVPVSRRRRHEPRAAQMVFQDVYGSLNPLHTVGHHLRRAVISSPTGSRNRAEVEGRVDALLTGVGLTPPASYLDRRPHELSGGQRQRVGLARALAANPKLLVADEPVSMLDVSIRRDILALIARLRDEQGVAVLYITHDVVSAGYIADRIAVMHRGEIVEEGPAKAVLANPRHEYTKCLIAAVPGGLGVIAPQTLEPVTAS